MAMDSYGGGKPPKSLALTPCRILADLGYSEQQIEAMMGMEESQPHSQVHRQARGNRRTATSSPPTEDHQPVPWILDDTSESVHHTRPAHGYADSGELRGTSREGRNSHDAQDLIDFFLAYLPPENLSMADFRYLYTRLSAEFGRRMGGANAAGRWVARIEEAFDSNTERR